MSLSAWHYTGLWQILVLCAGPSVGLWELMGLGTRPDKALLVFLSLTCTGDLFWATICIYSRVPAEVLIRMGVWNCDRALYECGTGAMIEQAVKKKGCHS